MTILQRNVFNGMLWFSFCHHTHKPIFKEFLYTFFAACVCDQNGSEDKYCNDDGLCTCKENYAGDRCDNCEIGSLGYPNCTSMELCYAKMF